MTKVTFDFSVIPDLGVSEEGGSVVTHPTTLGLTEVSLGSDDTIRIGDVPVVLFLHYLQSASEGDNALTVADLETDILSRSVASGSLAQVLFEHPHLTPLQWQRTLTHQSIIFWGTEVRTISGSRAYPTLCLIGKDRGKYEMIRSSINVGRCIYLRMTALLVR